MKAVVITIATLVLLALSGVALIHWVARDYQLAESSLPEAARVREALESILDKGGSLPRSEAELRNLIHTLGLRKLDNTQMTIHSDPVYFIHFEFQGSWIIDVKPGQSPQLNRASRPSSSEK